MQSLVKHAFASFMYLFCLANFIVGTLTYIINPHQISPVPDTSTMTLLGIASAVISLVNAVKSLRVA